MPPSVSPFPPPFRTVLSYSDDVDCPPFCGTVRKLEGVRMGQNDSWFIGTQRGEEVGYWAVSRLVTVFELGLCGGFF